MAGTAISEADKLASPARLLDIDLERARAWHAVTTGQISHAHKLLQDAASSACATGRHALEGAALHDVVRLGNAHSVHGMLTALAETAEGELPQIRAAHASALHNEDVKGLGAVADRFERMGACLLAAEAAAQAATLCRTAGDDRQETAQVRRAMTLARQCEGAETPALALAGTPSVLTTREREVAVLVAQGLTSKAAGERLCVSVRTVDNHLQRIFRKLGIRKRRELASALACEPTTHPETK